MSRTIDTHASGYLTDQGDCLDHYHDAQHNDQMSIHLTDHHDDHHGDHDDHDDDHVIMMKIIMMIMMMTPSEEPKLALYQGIFTFLKPRPAMIHLVSLQWDK